MAAIFRSRVIAANRQYGGPFATPVGTTLIDGTPADTPIGGRRVVLFDQASFATVAERWSAPSTGQWQFQNLRAGTFFVVAFDHTGVNSGVIETDIVVPEPPPAP